MSLIYKNITGSDAVTLIDVNIAGKTSQKLDYINLCNTHDTDSVDLDIYYSNSVTAAAVANNWDAPLETVTNFYLLKNIKIPKGTTLRLNNRLYSLVVKLSAADSSVDITIGADLQNESSSGSIYTNSLPEY